MFPTQKTNQKKQRGDIQNQKLHPIECYACGSSNHVIKYCKKKDNIIVSYEEEETLIKPEMSQIRGEYDGEVKKCENKTW